MKITLTLTDSQVARLRELDAVIDPGHPNLNVISLVILMTGIEDAERRWQPQLEALKEKQK